MREEALHTERQKNQLRFAFFALIAPLVLAGCGSAFDRIAPDGFTAVQFGSGGGSGSSRGANAAIDLMEGLLSAAGLSAPDDVSTQTIDGGLIVYAINENNPMSMGRRFLSREGETTWLLPNGSYLFHAVGFTGSAMSGSKYCGIATGDSGPASPVHLNGNPRTVRLTMGTSGCDAPPFHGPLAYSSLTVNRCSSSPPPSPLSTCTASGTLGIRFAIYGRDEFQGPQPVSTSDPGLVESTCLSGTSGSLSYGTPPYVFGSLSHAMRRGMRAEVLMYSTLSCTDTPVRFMFPFGIAAAGNLPGGPATVFRDDVPAPETALMTFHDTATPVLYLLP